MTPRDLDTIRRELAEAVDERDTWVRIVNQLESELWEAEQYWRAIDEYAERLQDRIDMDKALSDAPDGGAS